MNDRVRLEQVRALRDRLERLPASPQRDRVLDDVRRRAVDIESGMPTAPMRPLESEDEVRLPEPAGATSASDPSRIRPVRHATPTTPHPARVRTDFTRGRTSTGGARAARPTATPLQAGVRLCLDDDVAVSCELDGRRPAAHWTRGLRG
jgi:hypothetical protein